FLSLTSEVCFGRFSPQPQRFFSAVSVCNIEPLGSVYRLCNSDHYLLFFATLLVEVSCQKFQRNDAESTKKSLISFAFHGTPIITTEKLNGKNYLNWHSSVEIWFLGQRLSDHLTKKVSEIDAKSRDDWKAADYQLVSVLWNSIEPKLMVHFRPYRTCYEVWQKAKNLYANDIQRLYESVRNLATLQMTDHDLSKYLARAQSTIDGLKLMLVNDDPKKVLEKLDNMFMVFILHGLPREYGAVRDQALTNTTIPTVEELIDRLTRVSLPSDDTKTAPESSAFIYNSNDRSRGRGRGRGRGQGRGRGG
ncbi:hypothetical protein TSUD_423020, partial [Trifolium subterraneum]